MAPFFFKKQFTKIDSGGVDAERFVKGVYINT